MVSRSGFTIIEIAAVFVIIALVVGGVLVGRDLLHAAELRADMKEVDRLQSAVQTFQAKYKCLPGDCSNATTILPTATAAANGNGDGYIASSVVSMGQILNTEYLFAVEHLRASGLYQLSAFDPVGGVGGALAIDALPRMKSTPSMNMMLGCPLTELSARQGHFIRVGLTLTAADGFGTTPAPYTPGDAYAIDVKSDDGFPLTGNIISAANNAATVATPHWATSTPAASGACVSTATRTPYNLSEEDKLCGLRIKMPF